MKENRTILRALILVIVVTLASCESVKTEQTTGTLYEDGETIELCDGDRLCEECLEGIY